MPTVFDVIDYMNRLPNTEQFMELSSDIQEKHIFNATESLKSYFGINANPVLNERVIALQTLYMMEGDSEEFSKLKRHGVSSFSAKDVSVGFEKGADLSSEVIGLLERLNPKLKRRGRVGRLI